MRNPPLFDHQKEAVAATLSELAVADRCKVLMACATGKTRIGVEIAVARNARTVVVYVPSLALLRQMLPDWIDAPFDGGMSYLCVCSDKTVAQGDEVIVTAEELIADLHLGNRSVTTQAADVRDFLTLPGFTGVRVLFSTYQSSDVVRDGCPEGFAFDLGIFDEAHRTAGKDSAFSAPLLDSHTPIAKRVFMTATPKHFDYRKRNKEGEARAVFSMDDEAIYGRAAFRLPIRSAIERGLIAGYQILVSVVNDQMIAENLNQKHVRYEGNDAELMAHALAIRNAMDTYGIKKVVTFHDSVAEAKLFAENPAIQQELGTSMFHVNGFIPTRERSRVMDQFAVAPAGLVTNARCLTEGVDVPAIDMVAFLHPRKSHVDIIQAIGRALRLPTDGTKDTGYILLPLYVNQLENGGLEAALEQYGYDTIWQVIQALREQDEVIEAALRDGMIKGSGEKRKLDFIHVIGRAVDLPWLREVISTRCIEALGDTWEKNYGILERFHREGKDVNVLRDTIIDGVKIGNWVARQRQAHKRGELPPERASRLEAIGLSWDVWADRWAESFAILEHLHREGKDVNVLRDTIIDGVKIGNWVINQRQAHKRGELPPERASRLEAIGLSWDVFADNWAVNFSILERLYREGKDVNVVRGTIIDGVDVGAWAAGQRYAFKLRELPQSYVTLLNFIGFKWGRG